MPDYTPVFVAVPPITQKASATITAGNLVEVSGTGTVAHAAAASAKVVGVAGQDAINGQFLTVYAGAGNVHETVNTGGVTAGDHLKSTAAGAGVTATPATYDVDIGIALTTATTTNIVRWIST